MEVQAAFQPPGTFFPARRHASGQVRVVGLICPANGSSSSEAVAIDANPPMNAATDAGSSKEAADDP